MKIRVLRRNQRINSLKLTWHLPEGLLKRKLHLSTPIYHICDLLVSGRVSTKINFSKQKVVSTHLQTTPTTLETILQKHPNVSLSVSLSATLRLFNQLRVGDLPAVGESFAAANLESAGNFPIKLTSFPKNQSFETFEAIMLLHIICIYIYICL